MEPNSDEDVYTTDFEESESDTSSGSNSEDDESFSDYQEQGEMMGLQPYQFEPVLENVAASESDDNDGESSEDEDNETRLGDTEWCTCEHCQIMDRTEECVCCHEVTEVMNKNDEVFEIGKLSSKPDCITDNPAFAAVCLNQWVLQVAWYHYKQQYGTAATEGPEHQRNRHVAYRQLVRWCWGTLGKEIRVPLPSCAVSCIRAHFPPPGLEENFVFEGFHFADE